MSIKPVASNGGRQARHQAGVRRIRCTMDVPSATATAAKSAAMALKNSSGRSSRISCAIVNRILKPSR